MGSFYSSANPTEHFTNSEPRDPFLPCSKIADGSFLRHWNCEMFGRELAVCLLWSKRSDPDNNHHHYYSCDLIQIYHHMWVCVCVCADMTIWILYVREQTNEPVRRRENKKNRGHALFCAFPDRLFFWEKKKLFLKCFFLCEKQTKKFAFKL